LQLRSSPTNIGGGSEISSQAFTVFFAKCIGKREKLVCNTTSKSVDRLVRVAHHFHRQTSISQPRDDLQIVWRSPPIPYSAHSISKDLPDALKRRLRAGLMDMRREAPGAYLAIEPDLPGGFEPVVHADYRPVLRTFEDEYSSLLEVEGRR